MLKRGFGEDQTFSPAKRRRTQTSQTLSRQEERWERHEQKQEQEQEQEQPCDRLSNLSDELILHILSYLSTSSLLECQRVSHRFHTLANDSELWKAKYYTRFVWPRTLRIRRRTAAAIDDNTLDAAIDEDAHPPTPSRPQQAAEGRTKTAADRGRARRPSFIYTPRTSKWLGHERVAPERAARIHWKRQYRLRHNWARGTCKVSEVEVAGRGEAVSAAAGPETETEAEAGGGTWPPRQKVVCARVAHGVVFTADGGWGVRAWDARGDMECIARRAFQDDADDRDETLGTPTAISVAPHDAAGKAFDVGVGFTSGAVLIYTFHRRRKAFELRLAHLVSRYPIVTLALSLSYLFTFSHDRTLALYALPPNEQQQQQSNHPPRLMTSLSTQCISHPISLSMRQSSADLVASIAYSFPRLSGGWSVGIQELRFNASTGQTYGSRVATAVDGDVGVSSSSLPAEYLLPPPRPRSRPRNSECPSRNSITHTDLPPTSLSYSHPYLLTSHGDNTLTFYLVISTQESLVIKPGRQLCGHTSAVQGVEVSDRGKAVSVSLRGDDVRLWELEEVVSLPRNSRAALRREESVRVQAEEVVSGGADDSPESEGASKDGRQVTAATELRRMSEWVGFDEEQVVVLLGQELGPQMLACYDFT